MRVVAPLIWRNIHQIYCSLKDAGVLNNAFRDSLNTIFEQGSGIPAEEKRRYFLKSIKDKFLAEIKDVEELTFLLRESASDFIKGENWKEKPEYPKKEIKEPNKKYFNYRWLIPPAKLHGKKEEDLKIKWDDYELIIKKALGKILREIKGKQTQRGLVKELSIPPSISQKMFRDEYLPNDDIINIFVQKFELFKRLGLDTGKFLEERIRFNKNKGSVKPFLTKFVENWNAEGKNIKLHKWALSYDAISFFGWYMAAGLLDVDINAPFKNRPEISLIHKIRSKGSSPVRVEGGGANALRKNNGYSNSRPI